MSGWEWARSNGKHRRWSGSSHGEQEVTRSWVLGQGVRVGFTGELMRWSGTGDEIQLQEKEPRTKKAEGFPKPAGRRSETRQASMADQFL